MSWPPAWISRRVNLSHIYSKDIAAASRISRGLVEQGFGVLRFDLTSLGASDGEFANTTVSSNVDDLVRAEGMVRGPLSGFRPAN